MSAKVQRLNKTVFRFIHNDGRGARRACPSLTPNSYPWLRCGFDGGAASVAPDYNTQRVFIDTGVATPP